MGDELELDYSDWLRRETLCMLIRKAFNGEINIDTNFEGVPVTAQNLSFDEQNHITAVQADLTLCVIRDETANFYNDSTVANDVKKILYVVDANNKFGTVNSVPGGITNMRYYTNENFEADRNVRLTAARNEKQKLAYVGDGNGDDDDSNGMVNVSAPKQESAVWIKGVRLLCNIKIVAQGETFKPSENSMDLVLRLPKDNIPHQVCCFNSDAKMIFIEARLYRPKSSDVNILWISNGVATALSFGAAKYIYVLNENNGIVLHVNLYNAIQTCCNKIEFKGNTLFTSLDVLPYIQDFRATSYANGECLYTFVKPRMEMIECTTNLSDATDYLYEHIMENVVWSGPVMTLMRPSSLYEICIGCAMLFEKQTNECIIKTIVEKFATFLVAANLYNQSIFDNYGFEDGRSVAQNRTMERLYVLFSVANDINIKLSSENGNVQNFDMSCIYPSLSNNNVTVTVVDWVEIESGVTFPTPPYIVTR
ncbi:hypothetical protein EGW08_020749 [Elysia chlorotica]|uniref:Uncharacterized protein n=1 Tax=Elysia chlorotica TaxID=188477 RepID=A0A433SQJ7_ELYCH|nr:hypothetical protein EGW08_020749 [Elysia chlorotica]